MRAKLFHYARIQAADYPDLWFDQPWREDGCTLRLQVTGPRSYEGKEITLSLSNDEMHALFRQLKEKMSWIRSQPMDKS